MEVESIASDPDSRLLSHTEQRSSVRAYVARIAALLALREGFSHVHWADRAYPLLTLSFRGGHGVVYRFSAADKVFLLVAATLLALTKPC